MKELIVSEQFKPNCAMVVLDFLIRHSVIEPDSGGLQVSFGLQRFIFDHCDALQHASVCFVLDVAALLHSVCETVLFFFPPSEPYYQEFVAGLHRSL